MLKAILFDLDNTLLGNDVNTFLGHYFPLIGSYASDFIPARTFANELMVATQVAIANQNPELTNEAVFWAAFEERNALDTDALKARLEDFYAEKFGELQPLTHQVEAAPELLRFCQSRGLKIVVATNPLFPRTAIEQRLAWGGVSVDDFNYDLVTTFENMHAAKPNPAYYTEILERLGVRAEEALMVGDDWLNDIAPAAQLGLTTFWIAAPTEKPPDNGVIAAGQGSLADLSDRLQAGWLLSEE